MSTTLSELEKQARELPKEDRARLALTLIESLDPPDEGDVESAWLAEIERRCREIERGEVQLIPADQVMAEARRLLK